jgi:hypothetical protein
MRPRLSILMVSASFFIVGCARYEFVPDYKSPECADNHGSPTSGLLEVKRAPTAPIDSITGRVLARGSRMPVQYAAVLVDSNRARRAITDSAGRFAVPATPGTHQLMIQRIGYYRYSTSFRFTPRTELVVTLAEMMLDGPCSGFGLVAVKKPWWKIW